MSGLKWKQWNKKKTHLMACARKNCVFFYKKLKKKNKTKIMMNKIIHA